MDAVFHEKQQGSLCAQHCLNALLQGPYFTPVDLATLAQKLDDEERLRMAECGVDSEDYQRFIEQPSGNYDDSGYFSVQVISSALEVWELELVPYNSTEKRAEDAQKCPMKMKAFICNYRDHWFTIRRLGHQWFNLNSLLSQPELISDTYLAMFLAQLQQEGFSIFIVFGDFPECEADNLLLLSPAVRSEKSLRAAPSSPGGHRLGSGGPASDPDPDDLDLQRALRLSVGQGGDPDSDDLPPDADQTHTELRKALRFVREPSVSSQDEDLDLQRALCLSLENGGQAAAAEVSDDSELEKALRMSLECCDSSTSVELNADEVRRRRLNYLESRSNLASTSNERKVNT